MVLLPSGSPSDVELVKVETDKVSLLIKGKPYHKRYESLQEYRGLDFHDQMTFSVEGEGISEVKVFDISRGELSKPDQLRPIFFENNIYQIIVIPKNKEELYFYHEHPVLRDNVQYSSIGSQDLLMGNIQFFNEIGLTEFEIFADEEIVLRLRLEIFPVKLDYKSDYKNMLEEINDEIYNLAYHFIRRTFLSARTKLEGDPSRAEFFRLITAHFKHFVQALNRIEKQPHHELKTSYQRARADQLGKQDSHTRQYLQKRAHLFTEIDGGIPIGKREYIPVKGLRIRKNLSYNTIENRYVKWMVDRLIHKLEDLERKVIENESRWLKDDNQINQEVLNDILQMRKTLEFRLRSPFWKGIGSLDRSVMSLVMQMAPGYRDAFQIYLTVSKGLALQGSLYRMSVKDIAVLYEYWTFMKFGEILSKKYTLVSQDIVRFNKNGLFVNLEKNQRANRIYKHPVTEELITLTYQHHEGAMPTTNQIPDTSLRIEKKGKDFTFNYIFDAKYRIDYAQPGSSYKNKYENPGPMEEDINTMHRYRDAIVSTKEGPYERTAFGAYVLFPWFDEDLYKHHHFYQSIEKVNIGGLPFLPSATNLVEQFVENLIDKSPEEIYKEGILPKGTKEEWQSSIDDKVLVGLVSRDESYKRFIQENQYEILAESLKGAWKEADYVALYIKQGLHAQNGILVYGKIKDTIIAGSSVKFYVDHWVNLKEVIKPVNYGISTYILTTMSNLLEAKELPELFMKSREERILWRMLRRVSDQIKVDLDHIEVDQATKVKEYQVKDILIKASDDMDKILISNGLETVSYNLVELERNPSRVFRQIVRMVMSDSEMK